MLLALSDTHGSDGPRLSGRTAEAAELADAIVHAGDFTTVEVLDVLESHATVYGVSGNTDTPGVRERLPTERVFRWNGLRIAVVHGHEHTDTALSLFARQSNADLLVRGHTHDPEFVDGVVPILNPGSHADPRWNRPAHAELEYDEAAELARGRLVEPSGTVFERFVVESREIR